MVASEMEKRDRVSENVYSRVFGSRRLWIRLQIFKIQNGGFKMVASEMEKRDRVGENVYSRVFGSRCLLIPH